VLSTVHDRLPSEHASKHERQCKKNLRRLAGRIWFRRREAATENYPYAFNLELNLSVVASAQAPHKVLRDKETSLV
jgi:hypothetical protein